MDAPLVKTVDGSSPKLENVGFGLNLELINQVVLIPAFIRDN